MVSRTYSRWLVALALVIVAQISSRGQTPVGDVLANLKSSDWNIRAHAFKQIVDKAVVVDRDALKTALTDLMALEVPTMDSIYRSGTSAPYGEGYSEYISVLQRTLLNLAAPQDTRAAQLLAQGAYNDDSQFVVDLARFGESLVPTIVDMSKHDVGPKRWNAYGLAGELVKQNRESRITISSTGITQLKDILRAAVILSDFSDKIIGVRHLGEAGDITDLPLLQNIAATDTSAGTGRVQFPIRNAALAAISAIKSRP